MKKIPTILLALVFCISAIGQTPVMTMTTEKSIGSDFSFSLGCEINNTVIYVDFGDGNLVPQMINSYDTIRGQIVGSQTIKIYGERIKSLKNSNQQITYLDVTKNISLKQLDCSNNQLTSLDVSKNVAMYELICYANQLVSLDLSNNIALYALYCENNKLFSLYLTNNSALAHLHCDNNQLTTLDLSNEIALYAFDCRNNKLTSLDLTNNSALQILRCDNNQLTTLDVSKNTTLISLKCSNNFLTFATLPLKQTTWIDYDYAPQAAISAVKSLKAGEVIDLSSQLMINGSVTAYTWKTQGGTVLAEGTDYTLTDGKTVFLKSQSDSVYCEMTNASFPNFAGADVLKTTDVKILSGNSATEVSELENNVPSIYPNPLTDILNIKLASVDLPAVIGIYNLNGQQLVSLTIVYNTSVINMQQFTPGIYLLKLATPSQIIERKIIKQ
jgi:hypothetical protein